MRRPAGPQPCLAASVTEPSRPGAFQIKDVRITADPDATASSATPEEIGIDRMALRTDTTPGAACRVGLALHLAGISASTQAGLMTLRGADLMASLPVSADAGEAAAGFRIKSLVLARPDEGGRRVVAGLDGLALGLEALAGHTLADIDAGMETERQFAVQQARLSLRGALGDDRMRQFRERTGTEWLAASLQERSRTRHRARDTMAVIELPGILRAELHLHTLSDSERANIRTLLAGGPASAAPTSMPVPRVDLESAELVLDDIAASDVIGIVTGRTPADWAAESVVTLSALVPPEPGPELPRLAEAVGGFLRDAAGSVTRVTVRPERPVDLSVAVALLLLDPDLAAGILGVTASGSGTGR